MTFNAFSLTQYNLNESVDEILKCGHSLTLKLEIRSGNLTWAHLISCVVLFVFNVLFYWSTDKTSKLTVFSQYRLVIFPVLSLGELRNKRDKTKTYHWALKSTTTSLFPARSICCWNLLSSSITIAFPWRGEAMLDPKVVLWKQTPTVFYRWRQSF